MTLARFLLPFALLGAVASAEPTSFVTTWGAWPLCADGAIQNCSWYSPGSETYVLLIHGDTPIAAAYGYTVTGTLQDGSTRTVQGIAFRVDDSEGWTTVGPMTFGGIVTTTTITISELAIVRTGKTDAMVRRQ